MLNSITTVCLLSLALATLHNVDTILRVVYKLWPFQMVVHWP